MPKSSLIVTVDSDISDGLIVSAGKTYTFDISSFISVRTISGSTLSIFSNPVGSTNAYAVGLISGSPVGESLMVAFNESLSIADISKNGDHEQLIYGDRDNLSEESTDLALNYGSTLYLKIDQAGSYNLKFRVIHINVSSGLDTPPYYPTLVRGDATFELPLIVEASESVQQNNETVSSSFAGTLIDGAYDSVSTESSTEQSILISDQIKTSYLTSADKAINLQYTVNRDSVVPAYNQSIGVTFGGVQIISPEYSIQSNHETSIQVSISMVRESSSSYKISYIINPTVGNQQRAAKTGYVYVNLRNLPASPTLDLVVTNGAGSTAPITATREPIILV